MSGVKNQIDKTGEVFELVSERVPDESVYPTTHGLELGDWYLIKSGRSRPEVVMISGFVGIDRIEVRGVKGGAGRTIPTSRLLEIVPANERTGIQQWMTQDAENSLVERNRWGIK